MRVAGVAAAVLICWSGNAPLNAIEFVALRFSCNYITDKVELVPSAPDRLHVVVSDREQKAVKICIPGSADKCRRGVIHRFDLLCGERKVAWRMIAEQLVNLTAVSAETGNASVRAQSEQWQLQALRAEPGFAPVDELGGRIFSFVGKPLEGAASRRASDVNTVASEIPNPAPRSFSFEPDPTLRKPRLPKDTDGIQLAQSQPGSTQSALISQDPSTPPTGTRPPTMEDKSELAAEQPRRLAIEATTKPADAAKLILPTQKGDSEAAANSTNAQSALRDNLFIAKLVQQRWDGEQAGRFVVVLVFTFLLTFVLLALVHIAVKSRKSVFGLRAAPDGQVRLASEAQACHDLMKQVASELMRATSAVNGLQEVPALQRTLYRELNSIRRLLGFTPQTQGNSREKEDWHRIKLQLLTSLQGTQRIGEIAEAARASFSSAPTTPQDVTTRLDAYTFLGINATSSEPVLKKTVNALRLCWHPDLATNEEDRRLRETRIKQINMAWDLISRKRMSA